MKAAAHRAVVAAQPCVVSDCGARQVARAVRIFPLHFDKEQLIRRKRELGNGAGVVAVGVAAPVAHPFRLVTPVYTLVETLQQTRF